MTNLICLLSVRLDGAEVAIDAPAGFDRAGAFIDLGPRLREAFGGGVQASADAVLELKVRWIPAVQDELLERADGLIAFYNAEPQGIGTATPCECARRAIEQDCLRLDPDCAANRCKELRR